MHVHNNIMLQVLVAQESLSTYVLLITIIVLMYCKLIVYRVRLQHVLRYSPKHNWRPIVSMQLTGESQMTFVGMSLDHILPVWIVAANVLY